MNYQEFKPTDELLPFVEKLWYCAASDLTNKTLTIPLPYSELTFDLCDSSQVRNKNGEIAKERVLLSGVQESSHTVINKEKHEMIGVLFKLNGLSAFTRIESSQFRNQHVSAKEVFGSSIAALYDKLQNSKEVKDKINNVQRYLISQMHLKSIPEYIYNSNWLTMIELDNFERSFYLSRKYNLSQKTIIANFNKFIGLTPTNLMKLIRVNLAIRILSNNDFQDKLTEVAYSLNYFDQAHFIREFKSITSMSPGQYLKWKRMEALTEEEPNFILH